MGPDLMTSSASVGTERAGETSVAQDERSSGQSRRRPWLWALLMLPPAVVAAALPFFAGNVVYPILSWPAATVTHTLPAILAIWNVIVLMVAARSPRRWVRVTAVVLALLMGFAIGSLGEAFFVVSAVYAG